MSGGVLLEGHARTRGSRPAARLLEIKTNFIIIFVKRKINYVMAAAGGLPAPQLLAPPGARRGGCSCAAILALAVERMLVQPAPCGSRRSLAGA